MDPIDILMHEHRVIERVLDALVVTCDAWYRGGGDARPTLAQYVRFVREFADGRHHGKEEDLLFAAMVDHGVPRDHGPIACMLSEHDDGRRLVAALSERAAQPTPWTEADRLEIIRLATSYAAMLRAHIVKEDRMLYPLARARLPPAALAALAAAFARQAPPADEPLVPLAAALIAQAQAIVHRVELAKATATAVSRDQA